MAAGDLEGLAGTLFREALSSPWWRSPTRRSRLLHSSPGQAVERAMRRWAGRLGGRLEVKYGLRVYRRVSYSLESEAVLSLFLEGAGDYYLFYALAGDIVEARTRRGRYAVPMSLVAALARLPGKYGRFYDYILPRYRRRIEGHGYLVEAQRLTRDPGVGGEWMLAWRESWSVSSKHMAEPGGLSLETILELAEAGGSYIVAANCYEADMVFQDYKARYVLLLGPLVVWKWGHTLAPLSIYNAVGARRLCGSVKPQ